MLLDTNRTAAALCAGCSDLIFLQISPFSFSGKSSVTAICPKIECGENSFTILKKGRKFKIDVHCAFCGNIHSMTIDADKFWSRELITLPCPETGISTFLFGDSARVKESFNEILASIDKLYDAMDDLYSFGEYEGEPDEDDIVCDILDQLYFLLYSGKLSCACGSKSLYVDAIEDKIIIACRNCHSSKLFDADEQTLDMISKSKSIVIGEKTQ